MSSDSEAKPLAALGGSTSPASRRGVPATGLPTPVVVGAMTAIFAAPLSLCSVSLGLHIHCNMRHEILLFADD